MSQTSVRTESEKRLVALHQCLQSIHKQDTPVGVGKIALDFVKEWFPFELIWFACYDAQRQTLDGIDGVLPQERDQAALRSEQPMLPGDLFDQAVLTGRSQEISSLKQESRVGDWQAIAQRQGIQGALILPIRYRSQSLGVLLLGTSLWGGHTRTEDLTQLKMLTGALGAALYHHRDAQRSITPQSQPLVATLSQILNTSTFEARLKLVLESVHQTIGPSRTCVYWFDSQAQICRLQEIYTGPPPRRAPSVPSPTIEIALQQIAPFYQATLQNQVVAIADVQSMTHSHHAPTRLMNLTKSRSWLSVPILEQRKCVGVLVVEGNDPHLWPDSDRQYMQLMAQLLSQSPKGDQDSTPLWSHNPTQLPSLLNVLKETEHESEHWEKTLQHCLEQIAMQFAARWAVVLSHDPDSHVFECRAQFCQKKKQPLPERLPALSEVDIKLMTRLSAPMPIQSTEQDLRLLGWRTPFEEAGIQSCLLIKMGQQNGLGKFFLLGADLPRTWTPDECESVVPIVQSLGQGLSRRTQWLFATQQQQLMEVLTQGMGVLQQVQHVEPLFTAAAQSIHQLLRTECLMILRWSTENPTAQMAGLINGSTLQVDLAIPILWQTDPLIQALLVQLPQKPNAAQAGFPGVVTLRESALELTAQNGGWLTGLGLVDVLGVPLKTHPEEEPMGLVLALDPHRQRWSALHREGVQLLTRELAIHAQSRSVIQQLTQKRETLECLNWYKQRQFESLHRLWTEQTATFQGLLSAQEAMKPPSTGLRNRPQQPIVQLNKAFNAIDHLLKGEVWELQLEVENVSVATLLRRSLERIEGVVRTRQLWTQVHNLTPSVSVRAPSQKLELMLVELLLASCYRTKVGDRLDIWCRALENHWVELSITDHGRLNPQLVSALAKYPQLDETSPVLESPPGLHFKICQSLAHRFGGQLELAQLEDGRSLSRLILPLAV